MSILVDHASSYISYIHALLMRVQRLSSAPCFTSQRHRALRKPFNNTSSTLRPKDFELTLGHNANPAWNATCVPTICLHQTSIHTLNFTRQAPTHDRPLHAHISPLRSFCERRQESTRR